MTAPRPNCFSICWTARVRAESRAGSGLISCLAADAGLGAGGAAGLEGAVSRRVTLTGGEDGSFFASAFSGDLITGISFSPGMFFSRRFLFGDLERGFGGRGMERLGTKPRRAASPAGLNWTEVTMPSVFSICSGNISSARGGIQ
jgi:hypothetical protein